MPSTIVNTYYCSEATGALFLWGEHSVHISTDV